MGKIFCEVCICEVPDNPSTILQHNSGKRHQKELKGNKIYKDNIIHLHEIYEELKEIFPNQVSPLEYVEYPGEELMDEVLQIFYNTLLNFEEELEISKEIISVLINYLDEVFVISPYETEYLKNMDEMKFISLFIKILKDDSNLSKELDKIMKYERLNKLLDEDKIEKARQEIIFNYEDCVKEYGELYEEASKSFNSDYQMNDF